MNWREKDQSKLPITKIELLNFMITDRANTMDCYDLLKNSTNFQTGME